MRILCLTIFLTFFSMPVFALDELRSVEESATAIDRLFEDSWKAEGVTPSNLSEDAAYFRRLHLDLGGRIPAVSELREFLADSSPNKRSAAVSQLLDSPAFVRHITTVWRNALIPQASSQAQFRSLIPGFEALLWKHISEGSRYDQIAREIITAELNSNNGGALAATTSPDAFFVVRELKPENLSAGTARAFLGVRLDCAQCHDHPFDKWSQKQFWNMAAFYSGFSRPESDEDNPAMMMTMTEDKAKHSIQITGTEEIVPAIFLDGLQPEWTEQTAAPREVLADWIVDSNNPYFARMAVNRLWAQFFGRGLVDPVDDFSENNPPSHPEVLQILADQFVDSGYDMKHLIRVITATQVYQLRSQQTDASQDDPIHFARAALRGMTPEQLFDSLAEAVGFYQPFRSDNPFVVETDSPRARFIDLFRDNAESALDRETTILQALAMMNGDFISNATDINNSQTLKAIAEFPAMKDADKLEALFMAALSRRPASDEAQRFGEYLKSGGTTGDPKQALADIFWVLLNSSEFLLNH